MAASDDCIIKRWLFSAELIKNTPSVRDGITSAEEMKLRKLACGFIADVGQNLIYPASIVAINSAKIFLHRFYMKESLKQFPDHKLVAVTCLFLACKTEECLRALKDFIWSWNKLEDGHPFGRYHGEDKQRKAWQLDESTKEFQEIRDNILQLERELLHVLGFDFQVYQAQAYIFRMIQFFDGVKRDKETRSLAITTDGEIRYTELGQQVITAAGAMVNDMTRTCLGIQYEATILGAACTFLALRTQNFLVSSTEKWVKKLGEEWQNDPDPRYSSVKVTKEQIQDICNQLLDFYDDAEPSNQTAPSSARVPSTTTSTVTAPSSVVPDKAAPGPAPAASAKPPPADGHAKPAVDKLQKLEAGELVLMPGSGPKPYELFRKGNVYSCSCSIWRHIDDIEQRRTCKHLRQLRGEKAETGRVGEDGIRKSDEKLKELLEADKHAFLARQAAAAQSNGQAAAPHHQHPQQQQQQQQPPPPPPPVAGKRPAEGGECAAAIKRQHVA